MLPHNAYGQRHVHSPLRAPYGARHRELGGKFTFWKAEGKDPAGEAASRISQPGGPHDQSAGT
jgi:hypothetical protein